SQIRAKLKKIKFEDFDLVIAIGKGGVGPGKLVADYLKLPLKAIRMIFRDENHKPMYKNPKIGSRLKIKDKKILLVDDVSRTGATLKKAKKYMKGNKVKSFVVNGKADYSLFNFTECINWPWG
ncbi:MAG: phosphoribosyltransferase, partial [Candidatus Margulisiibacteriota bacterium]